MKKIIFSALSLGLILILCSASQASAKTGNYVDGQIIVRLKPELAQISSPTLSSQLDVKNMHKLSNTGLIKAVLNDNETVTEAVNRLKRDNAILDVQPNYIYTISSFTPDDPMYNYQWNFKQIKAEAAWDQDTTAPKRGGDPGIIVAIIDTGVAYENYGQFIQAPDLENTRFANGYDFVNNDRHPNDDNGHGTHMAGTIAQSTNNGVAAAGLAFETTIMPIKVLGANGSGTTDVIIEGLEYAMKHDADIINMSFGSTDTADSAYNNALSEAAGQGIILVAAAGNSGDGTLQLPASHEDVIAVSATQYDETRPSYANYGPGLNLMAPGGNINIDQNNDGIPDGIVQQSFRGMAGGALDYTDFTNIWVKGTSSSTAHVSAATALLLAAGVPSDNVQSILESTAKDLGAAGYDTGHGYGLIDLAAAFDLINGDSTAPTTTLSQNREPDGDNNYFLAAPKITLSAIDNLSGILSTHYRWDDNEYSVYEAPFSPPEGTHVLSYYSRDIAGNNESLKTATYNLDTRRVVVGANQGGGPHVRVFSTNGTETANFFAYASNFRGGVNVALGDVDGDGKDEIVTAPGPDGSPHIRIFSITGTFEKDFFAYDSGFRGGINIAVGDVDGGKAEIVTAPMAGGGPNVRIFGYRSGEFIPTTENFMAYDESFRGGISIAIADLEGNGMGEIITAPLSRGGPHIRIFGFRNKVFVPVILGLMAYDENFRGGVTIAGGDVDGDGRDEIITGVAAAGGPHIRIFGRQPDQTVQLEHPGFMAFSPDFRGGISIATSDYQADGRAEIVAAVRSDGNPVVRFFNREGTIIYEEYLAYADTFKQGINLASHQ